MVQLFCYIIQVSRPLYTGPFSLYPCYLCPVSILFFLRLVMESPVPRERGSRPSAALRLTQNEWCIRWKRKETRKCCKEPTWNVQGADMLFRRNKRLSGEEEFIHGNNYILITYYCYYYYESWSNNLFEDNVMYALLLGNFWTFAEAVNRMQIDLFFLDFILYFGCDFFCRCRWR